MPNPSLTESSKIGCLYRAVYVERFFVIIEETDLTVKLWFYPTYTFAVVSKAEFLCALEQNQLEFVEKLPYDVVKSINSGPTNQETLKKTYDDYHRRKQSIISGEL